ncbi:MAG TPA: acyl-CoA dehydrogenase family protein [Mycobacteriales bacterium]|nr:acyl-CoA dehydrogenase family protein [Mycobacteriales bacterium]
MGSTHEVTNQPPPLVGHDVFGTDRALAEGVIRHGAGWATDGLAELGTLAGTEQAQDWGRLANDCPPVLRTHDRYGHRIDEVELHPSWHELMRVAVGNGLHGAPWASRQHGAHVRRAAGFYVWSQVEAGHGCPVSMTYAVVPALRHERSLAVECEPRLTSTSYDPGLRPPTGKPGLLAGMGMTEKQGGSDVRANTTRALPQPDGSYRLTGHKWFCSAPMCDLFLVLAHTTPAAGARPDTETLTCFLVPRVLPDGERNPFRIQRLKDKLGNRSNASAEVELDQTVAWRVGPEGRGVPTIIEMVQMTRLDCVIGSAAGMRAALAQAIHHATYRSAFGGPLRDKPLMRNVLADLAVETEAATVLLLRLAAAVDGRESSDPTERVFGRIATAVGKFWVCKRGPVVVAEALECLGGNGYVEESGLPRLYREAPLNGIWEGSGNVIALDLLRAVDRQPESVDVLLAEIDLAASADARLDAAAKRLRAQLSARGDLLLRARRVAELMALCLQGSLLVRFAPSYVADAFCASRLDGDWGHVLGTLPPNIDDRAIVRRAAPTH